MGGSLRAPAHYCGVFAHKTSIGIVPLRGAAGPDAPVRPIPPDMAVTGPMARSAADPAASARRPGRARTRIWDGIGYPPRTAARPAYRPGRLQVLVLGENPLCPVARSVQDAVDGLARCLSGPGLHRPAPPSRDAKSCAHHPRLYRAAGGVPRDGTACANARLRRRPGRRVVAGEPGLRSDGAAARR